MTIKDYPYDLGEMAVSNGLLKDETKLRLRFENDGYLFLKGLIPADVIQQLRAKITSILAEANWIQGGAQQLAAKSICLPCREGEEEYFRVYDKLMCLQAFYKLAHEKVLNEVMCKVLGGSAFPHPLSITRLVFPDNPEITTPPHQDYRNNQGTPNLTAAWIPLGDCPVSMGPLAVLEGSHKFGLMPLDFHLGAGNRRAVLSEQLSGLRWLTADFNVGDVLLFPAMTVHSALENQEPERMRLSVDYRFQLEGEDLVEQSLKPHFQRLEWSEIYRNWDSAELQYYWLDKNYKTVQWDQSLQDLPEEHMKEAVRLSRNYAKARAQRFRMKSE